ncbi:hypothetical protein ACW180_03280 [Limosilactobacillus fermentum]
MAGAHEEVNLYYAREHNIIVTRRTSGVGRSLTTWGNVSFSFITKDDGHFSELC